MFPGSTRTALPPSSTTSRSAGIEEATTGSPSAHRLDDRAAQPFIEGGEGEDVAGGQHLGYVVAVTEQPDPSLQFRLGSHGLDLPGGVALPSREKQEHAGAPAGKHPDRRQQVDVALLVLLPPDVDDDLRIGGQAECLSSGRAAFRARRPEPGLSGHA